MSTLGLFSISNSIVLVTKPLNMKHTSHSYRLHPLNCVDVRFKIRYSKLTLVGLKVVTLSKTVGRVCTPPLWVMWAHGFIVLFLCFLIHTPHPTPGHNCTSPLKSPINQPYTFVTMLQVKPNCYPNGWNSHNGQTARSVRKPRILFTPQQSRYLEERFQEGQFPSIATRECMANLLELTPQQITVT